MASPETWLPLNKQLIRTKIHKRHILYYNSFLGYFPMSYVLQRQGMNFFKGSTQEIYFGMAEKYHIVGSYGGHKWHRFWLKVLDAREAFPLSTRLWLARLFEANTSMNRYSKTYIRTYCKHYKTLHCLPCCSNTFTRKYLDF